VRRQKQLFEKASSLSTMSDHVFVIGETCGSPTMGFGVTESLASMVSLFLRNSGLLETFR
jgi:hypothetical protein